MNNSNYWNAKGINANLAQKAIATTEAALKHSFSFDEQLLTDVNEEEHSHEAPALRFGLLLYSNKVHREKHIDPLLY